MELAFNEVQTLAVKNLTHWFASSHDGYAILMSPNKGGEKAVHMAATAGVIYDCGQEKGIGQHRKVGPCASVLILVL